jgi:phosphohistidine phosphatase
MIIYLIRHGDSEKTSIHIRDFDRELTENGRKVTEQAAKHWKKIIPGFDFIITSPFIRALQSAEIISGIFNVTGGIITDKKLSPGSRTDDIIEISNTYNGKSIAIVGHQPDMGEHVANLISNSYANVEVRKSAIARLSFGNKVKPGKGTLDFLIPPEIII